MKKKKKQ